MKIEHIHWAALDQWWVVAILSALSIALIGYRLLRIHYALKLLNRTVAGKRFLKHASVPKYILKSLFLGIGLISLLIVLLRPQWDKKQEIVMQEGRDLFIALDISRSMLAQDIKPSRLEFAKKKIKELVNALSTERVGLILFSSTSFISCPLTRDYDAFFMFLNQIDVESISSGTTTLDAPISQAVRAFSDSSRKSKLLVIVTDGEDFSPTLASTKDNARSLGLTVFALGIGTTQGAPIPLYDVYGNPKGHQKDKEGSIVISKLNEPLLQSLTADLGGAYIHAVFDDKDIAQLINHLTAFEKERFEDRMIEHYQEQYPWFLLISFIALLMEWIL